MQPRRLTRQLRLHRAARIGTERQPSRPHGWLLGRMKAARLQVESKRPCEGYDVKGLLSKGLEASEAVWWRRMESASAARLNCNKLPGAAGPRGLKRLRWTGIPRKSTGSSSGARCTQTGGDSPPVTST